ncbi:hypothetical protein [Enterococcus hulanensis]|uniref:hypothetical protein n=1 Tax=Enterococcus hulanensis TaxID=2559929 RepID=UPI0010F6F6DB|nr:hypothetical protein [Enterococcus hulanensis]
MNIDLHYILYKKDNWEDVKEFCEPFSIEKSRKNVNEGRAVIDLPTGNETFEYGIVLIRLGDKRILIVTPSEFTNLFSLK